MSQDLQDHRGFYRIQDIAILDFCVVDQELVFAEDGEFPIEVPAHFHLLNELRELDLDNSQLFRSIGESSRSIAAYLQVINRKLELIAQTLAAGNDDAEENEQITITLSEGGLSFNHSKPIKLDTYLATKLVLLPSYTGLLMYGRVVNCNEHISGDYLINMEFENLSESNRHLIARHVLQQQAQARREDLQAIDE